MVEIVVIAHPPDRRLELFFLVIITIAHPPDRRLEFFFPVVIMIAHHDCIFLFSKKKYYNTLTVWYSKYIVVCTTKTYFPPEPKTDTTAKLEKRFLQPTQSVGRFLQLTRSECIQSSVGPSFCPSVRAKRGIE